MASRRNMLSRKCSRPFLPSIFVDFLRSFSHREKKETMRRFIIIFTFFIQSHYAAFVKWKGPDPLSVSVGGYSFFATNNNDIYKFNGTDIDKLEVPNPPLEVKFQSESFIKCGDSMCNAVVLLGDTVRHFNPRGLHQFFRKEYC